LHASAPKRKALQMGRFIAVIAALATIALAAAPLAS
jgi:hypothetical protein